MAFAKPPLKVLPFCSIIYKHENIFNKAKDNLEKLFYKIKVSYGPVDFEKFTSYYEKEMGSRLKKIYLFFSELEHAENFHTYKIKTNEIEKDISGDTKRVVNLDPGYLTEAKFVMFSMKNNYHRVYINNGVYAEVQLNFRNNSYKGNPWSHKDYADPGFIDFANKTRIYLRKKLGK
jgi:hypothetical protein